MSGTSTGTKPLRVMQLNSIQMDRELCSWERDGANSIDSVCVYVRKCLCVLIRTIHGEHLQSKSLQTEQTKIDYERNGESDTPRGTQRCRWARQSPWTIALREQTSRAQCWQTDSYCRTLGPRRPLHCYADRTTPPRKPKPTRPADPRANPTVVLWNWPVCTIWFIEASRRSFTPVRITGV